MSWLLDKGWDAIASLQEACKESDYYAQVVRLSTAGQLLFPYHLVPHVGVTPFKYYIGILHQVSDPTCFFLFGKLDEAPV